MYWMWITDLDLVINATFCPFQVIIRMPNQFNACIILSLLIIVAMGFIFKFYAPLSSVV